MLGLFIGSSIGLSRRLSRSAAEAAEVFELTKSTCTITASD